MTDWRLGTMGYGYSDWLGTFYPENARPHNYLRNYAKVFDAVEMDTTFYGIPDRTRVRAWARQTPAGFVFCPKTPREITHEGRLEEKIERMAEFLDAVSAFDDRLGAILVQFPPERTIEALPQLDIFLSALPKNLHFAVEFRHRSWDIEETRDLLRKHGVSWASAEYISLPGTLHITAPYAYIRFLGRHGQFERKNRIQAEVQPVLKRWWTALRPHLDRLHTVYAFFNNDFSGHSPATCNAFKELAGLPVRTPNLPIQGRLF